MLFDCLNVFQCHEVDIPPGITLELYQRVVDEVTFVFNQMYAYPSMKEAAKVGIGFFVNDVGVVSIVIITQLHIIHVFTGYSLLIKQTF